MGIFWQALDSQRLETIHLYPDTSDLLSNLSYDKNEEDLAT